MICNINTTIKNYSTKDRNIDITHQLVDQKGKVVMQEIVQDSNLQQTDSIDNLLQDHNIQYHIQLWSTENPYFYKIVTYC